jgi:hypothetical protein
VAVLASAAGWATVLWAWELRPAERCALSEATNNRVSAVVIGALVCALVAGFIAYRGYKRNVLSFWLLATALWSSAAFFAGEVVATSSCFVD